MKSTLKKVILFVVILVVLIVLAILIFGKKSSNTDLQNNGALVPTSGAVDNQAQKFLQSLSQVKTITLDTTFFNDPAYQKLKDFSVPITLDDNRLIGRPNPFAPLGVDTVFNEPDQNFLNQVETPAGSALETNTQTPTAPVAPATPKTGTTKKK